MNELLKDLKENKIKNLYLIYGKEEYLRDFYIKEINKHVVSEALKEMNHDLFEDKIEDMNKLKEKLETFPFMSDRRIIHIRNCKITNSKSKTMAEEVFKLLENLPSTTVAVIEEEEIDKRSKIYKGISKLEYGQVLECSKLDETTLTRWIQKKLKEMDKVIDARVALYIIRRVGTDMRKVYTELQKLADYAEDRKIIKSEDVDIICSESVESKIFELLNEIGRKNLAKAIRIYKNLIIAKEPVQMIIYMIARQFIMINQVKMLLAKQYRNQDIAKLIGVQPFVVNECARQGEKFNYKSIKEVLNKIFKLDLDIKSGKVDPIIGLELFILDAARQG